MYSALIPSDFDSHFLISVAALLTSEITLPPKKIATKRAVK